MTFQEYFIDQGEPLALHLEIASHLEYKLQQSKLYELVILWKDLKHHIKSLVVARMACRFFAGPEFKQPEKQFREAPFAVLNQLQQRFQLFPFDSEEQ